jgi:hypothetical protein
MFTSSERVIFVCYYSGRDSMRAVPKLTETHLKPTSYQKISVKLAAQTSESRNVAWDFRYYRIQLVESMEAFKGMERLVDNLSPPLFKHIHRHSPYRTNVFLFYGYFAKILKKNLL